MEIDITVEEQDVLGKCIDRVLKKLKEEKLPLYRYM